MKINRTKDYYKKYSFHKFHYWERKLLGKNNEKLDTDLIYGKKISLEKSMELFKKNVDDIHLETSYYCNRKCSYCPVSIYERNEKIFMSDALLDSIIEGLKKIQYDKQFVLNLYNEPFAHMKTFLNTLQKIKKNLPKAIFLTHSNGDYIKNIDVLKKLSLNGLNRLKITLHTPPTRKYSRTYMEKRLIRFAKIIKFDLSKEEIRNLSFQFQVGKLYIVVQCTNFFVSGNSRGQTIDFLETNKTREMPCVRPFREFIIYYDGTVTPCCSIHHGENYNLNTVGKISSNNMNSIFEVYASKTLSGWRKGLLDWSPKIGVCATCKDNIDNHSSSLGTKEYHNKIVKRYI